MKKFPELNALGNLFLVMILDGAISNNFPRFRSAAAASGIAFAVIAYITSTRRCATWSLLASVGCFFYFVAVLLCSL
jgi:hypothetical protein